MKVIINNKKYLRFFSPCLFIILFSIVSCDQNIFNNIYNKLVPASVYSQEVSNFTAAQDVNTTDVSLTWVNPVDTDFASVTIIRKQFTAPDNIADSGAVSIYTGNAALFTDTGLSANSVYFYTIYTQNQIGNNSVGVTTCIEIIPLSATYIVTISDFTADQDPGTTDVTLTWINPVEPDFVEVTLLRKTGGYASGPDDSSAVTVYTGALETVSDPGLTDNVIYYYSIYAVNSDGKFSSGSRKTIEILPVPVAGSSSYDQEVSNFSAVADSSSIVFTWTNPVDVNFATVLLKRKTTGYPTAWDDPLATTIYSGALTTCTDSTVSAGNTYYYALYCRNSTGDYSVNPAKTYKNVVAFTSTIRLRCFYLAGGSSNYVTPFDNLVTAIDAFDPATDTVYPNVATLPTPRYGCAVASANGKLYIFGGLDSNKNIVARVDVLNLTSPTWPENIWSTAADMPLPRYSLRAETINNRIYVFGGTSDYLGQYGSPVYLNNVVNYMKNTNHIYDPDLNVWVVDDYIIPVLFYRVMNMASGVSGSNIFYAGGRTAGGMALVATSYIHNMTANYSQAITAGTFTTAAGEMASVVFTKKSATNTDVNVFFICGGTTTSANPYEPIRVVTTGANLVAISTCLYALFPNSAATTPTWATVGGGTPKSLQTARAYAQAEYYGNYVYVFCGLNNSGIPISTIEKLLVDDACAFTTGWASVGSAGFTARYGFDITRINN